jgi:hypothetical protein
MAARRPVGNTTRKILSTYGTWRSATAIPCLGRAGYIQQAAAGTTQIAGIFYGCKYLNTAVGRTVWSMSWPGTTQGSDAVAYLNTDPQSLFIAQSNNTAITFADIDANINFVAGVPNSVTGISTVGRSIDHQHHRHAAVPHRRAALAVRRHVRRRQRHRRRLRL